MAEQESPYTYTKPNAVINYTKFLGGVDIADQHCSTVEGRQLGTSHSRTRDVVLIIFVVVSRFASSSRDALHVAVCIRRIKLCTDNAKGCDITVLHDYVLAYDVAGVLRGGTQDLMMAGMTHRIFFRCSNCRYSCIQLTIHNLKYNCL
ncbi:uncharacterized protein LOC143259826 [Megalopta genalis]|uniref:uncharacterized protein LOC143259826 n=1 Tax=Megalopta genalis TaxID=115081 RepID=UPI003FD1E527